MYQDNNVIGDKLDKISDRLLTIDVTLAKQHIVLADHIERTEKLEHALLPLRRKIAMAEGVIYFLGVLGTIAAIYEALK